MALELQPDEAHPMVDALLRLRLPGWRRLNRAIDARDDMFRHALAGAGGDRDLALLTYFQVGLEQMRLVRTLASIRPDRPRRLLEFASGYGRLSRFLSHEPLAGETVVSDVLEDAMQFAADQFALTTVTSDTRPERFTGPAECDLIFVASLFTHLPMRTFGGWLAALTRCLSDEGILTFTVHDSSLAPGAVDGLRFEPHSESPTLNPEEYGSTWVTEDFVRDHLTQLGFPAYVRLPRALNEWQDVYVASRTRLEAVAFALPPRGFVDHCEDAGDRLILSGWAAGHEEPVARIDIRVDDELIESVGTFAGRPDLQPVLGDHARHAGWRCEVPLNRVRSRRYQTLTISAWSSDGAERILYLGSVEGAAGEVARERARLLAAKVDGMMRSRFWRARDQWFRLKRALGLTSEP